MEEIISLIKQRENENELKIFKKGKSMKKKQFWWNIISSYGAQFVTTICAFILPKFILLEYGSDVNGLVSSITQFLSVVSLTDIGIEVVVQSALYKPLANRDSDELSRILVSAQKFYRVISYGLVTYTAVLCVFYPMSIDSGFDAIYVIVLIVILSIDSIAQYLFGITRNTLIIADQKKYIISISSIVTRIANTVICCGLIELHASIQVVKFASALVFLINPVISSVYVKKNYSINWRIEYDKEPIAQKWSGVAQHISNFVFENTDVMILTWFSTLANVSVYSVYNMVLKGIKQLLSIMSSVVQPMLGEYWAKDEKEKLSHYFSMYEWLMFILGQFVFGCAITLMIPFVQVYTKNIEDANYIVPVFSYFITFATAVQFLRIPYGTLIGSLGLYKETQSNYIICAVINVVISVVSVYKFGLVGVAFGTLIASLYMLIWQSWYVYKIIFKDSLSKFGLQIVKTIVIYAVGIFLCNWISLVQETYLGWVILACIHALIWAVVILVINFVFDRKKAIGSLHEIRKMFGK